MITKKKYRVAVILINYNSGSFTKNCIASIISKTSYNLSYQIIVIDNASEKDDFLALKSYCDNHPFSGLQLIRNNINVGFGAGNMLGVHYADAEYLAFVNNDSLLTNDCLSIIIEAMQKDSNMGICGHLAYKEDGSLLPNIDHFASPAREILGRKCL